MNDKQNYDFTPENISKYWNILNNTNNPEERKAANFFISELKKKCKNLLHISIKLFSSESIEDKVISSILIYQYIKDNTKQLALDQKLFNEIKEYLLNQILIPYAKSGDTIENENNKKSLIIERICYSMSIIVLLGCFSHWPNAIEDMITFGKQTIKHTYLLTIIFSNCNKELKDLFFTKNQEFIIKNKFIEKKDEFKIFLNTIFINSNNIDKKLYKKTIDLAKNLTTFEVNVLHIPNLINIIISDINISNIESISELITESINTSNSKKLDDEYNDLDINDYCNKIIPDELKSLECIIEKIISFVQQNNNPDENIIFGLGQIFSSITENFIYIFFKKNILSQKILNLLFYFISHKKRRISQLFFETIATLKNFINVNYKFSNYSQKEKIEFSNFLIKILLNVINNCTLKTIIKKQDILLNNEYISLNNLTNNNDDINEKEEDYLDDINEITIEDYRNSAEDVFINIFSIFAVNYGKDGVNYFFEQITLKIFPLFNVNIRELKDEQILLIEVIIYVIKCIVNCFESLELDKSILNKFTLILINSRIILNNFILSNFLLLIYEESTNFEYNKPFYSQLIMFLLNQLTIKIKEENSESINRLITTVLLSICDASNGLFVEEIWDKMYQVYIHYYDNFSFLTLYNLTESLSSSLIMQEDESDSENGNNKKESFLSSEEIINHFKKVIESPILRILKIGEIIINKDNVQMYGNKEDFEKKVKLEIIKNFNVIECVLKQCSFIEDKRIINDIFSSIYNKISQCLAIIINKYNADNEIINCIMTTITKCSSHFRINYLEEIFSKLNELMIKSFFNNNDNYQCINVLKNIYSIKLQNIQDKNLSNNKYYEIYNFFLKLVRQICSAIISSSSYKLELMQCLSSLFVHVFPSLNSINKDDYVIISDTIILLNEGIKTLCENNIMNNILYAFISFIESPNPELINEKFEEIVKNVFYAFDHFNQKTIKSFISFCSICLKNHKRSFIIILKDVLNTSEFNCFDTEKKIIIYNYIDHFSNNIEKLKKLFGSILNVIQKNIYESTDDLFKNYNRELLNDINKIEVKNKWIG